MARKSFEEEDLLEQDPTPGGATAEKIPMNIYGGKTAIPEYMYIPMNQLIPFRDKQGRDFSRKDDELFQELVNSIREGGIIDALAVRPIGPNRYEILAGETRWLAAQEAGLTVVPCHVMNNIDDTGARRIFTVTNLMRRTLLPSDRINGWWHFYQAMKAEGRLRELREGLSVGPNEKIQYRQIMYYVSMYTLIPEWLDRLDDGQVPQRTAREIARLDEEKQRQLLPYSISDAEIPLLVEVANGKHGELTWSEEFLASMLTPLVPPAAEKTAQESQPADNENRDDAGGGEAAPPEQREAPAADGAADKEIFRHELRFRKARPSIIKAVRNGLRPDDYENAGSIIAQALKLYYQLMDGQAERDL